MAPSKLAKHRRRVRSRSYYPTTPGPNFCWVCGGSLDTVTWKKRWPLSIVFENEEWLAAWQKNHAIPRARRPKFTIYAKTSELDKSMEINAQWASLFRMIVFSKDDKYLPQGYHLSGIGDMPGARTTDETYILVPRDTDTACVGIGRENNKTLKVSPVPHPFRDTLYSLHESRLEGHALHSRCWDLIERQMGPVALSRLDLIVQALRAQWETIIPQLGPESFGSFICFLKYQKLGDGFRKAGRAMMADPLFIPEVDTLLQDSAKFLSHMASNGSYHSLGLLTVKYSLPAEIKYLIADYLNSKDTYNMLLAFGERFPVDYWKRQISTDINFELEKADPSALHWPYIACELESTDILGTSCGLWNRKRILNMLAPITQYVLKRSHSVNDLKLSDFEAHRIEKSI